MPGTSPRVSFDKDVLGGGTGASDGVDGGLVELADEGIVLVVELVVGVKDDLLVSGVALSYGSPPGSKSGDVGDDVAVVATEVVRVDYSVSAPNYGEYLRGKVQCVLTDWSVMNLTI